MKRTTLQRAAAGAAVAFVALGMLAPSARAEGPGYGGTADTLSVAWVASDDVPATVSMGAPKVGGGARMSAFVRVAEPVLVTDGVALVVRGLGFRGKSAIEVRVGSAVPVVARADSAGALAVALDPDAVGSAQPGVSVMAIGRNQSGTEVTLFGSVPPVSSGNGPMTYVPWLAVGVAALGGFIWWRRRTPGTPTGTPADTPTGTPPATRKSAPADGQHAPAEGDRRGSGVRESGRAAPQPRARP